MTKHIILWTLKETLSAEEKVSVKAAIKEGLEVWLARSRAWWISMCRSTACPPPPRT